MKHQLCVQMNSTTFKKLPTFVIFNISEYGCFFFGKTIELIDVKKFLREQKSDDSLLM